MNLFNIGERAICVDSSSGFESVLTVGRVYVIKDVYGSFVDIVNDRGQLGAVPESRLERMKPVQDLPSSEIVLKFLKGVLRERPASGASAPEIASVLRRAYGISVEMTPGRNVWVSPSVTFSDEVSE